MTSRLWRRLGATEALFNVALTDGVSLWDDHDIGSWTTTRGGTEFGVQPSTAQAVVRGEVIPARDPSLRILFTPAGAAHIAALVGNRTTGDLENRWHGRFAGSTVEDRPDRSATLQGADLLALAAAVNPTIPAFTDGTRNLPALYEQVWGALGLPLFNRPTFTHDPADRATDWDAVRTNAARPWADVADKYAKEAGVILFMDRAGNMHARNVKALQSAASLWVLTGNEPLTRRQCLAPATWESVLNPAKRVQGTLWDGTNTYTYPAPTKPAGSMMTRTHGTETHDLTHLVSRTAYLERRLDGMWEQVNDTLYHVPTVTVDLLRLLSSELAHDRAQAGTLLTLDPFDAIVFGYDWPDHVRGTYYAAGITETVTPDSWTITLGLLPSRHVVGLDYPDQKGQTWATAYDTTDWDTAYAGDDWQTTHS